MGSRETREEAISWFPPPRVSGKEIIRRTSFRNGRAYAMINDFKETGHIPDPKLVGWPPKEEDRGFKGTRRSARFAEVESVRNEIRHKPGARSCGQIAPNVRHDPDPSPLKKSFWFSESPSFATRGSAMTLDFVWNGLKSGSVFLSVAMFICVWRVSEFRSKTIAILESLRGCLEFSLSFLETGLDDDPPQYWMGFHWWPRITDGGLLANTCLDLEPGRSNSSEIVIFQKLHDWEIGLFSYLQKLKLANTEEISHFWILKRC
jgi:hypothetical protein